MAFRIYSNNCKNGDYHIGIRTDVESLDERTLVLNTQGDVTSFVTVSLNTGTPINWNTIEDSVDEAFSEIRKPTFPTQYSIPTAHGKVELLAAPGIFETADVVKAELRDVVEILRTKGRTISL
ncbi:hypothetical protein ACFL6E_02380 [Candidatus Neomarinimicrobiota bacterium]